MLRGSEPSSRSALLLRYERSPSEAFSHLASLMDGHEYEMTVALSNSRLALPFTKQAPQQFLFDLLSKTRLHVDHMKKTFTIDPISRRDSRVVTRSYNRRSIGFREVANTRVAAWREKYECDALLIQCISGTKRGWPNGTELWELLLPSVNARNCFPSGIPLEVRITTSSSEPVGSLRLVNVTEISDDEVTLDVTDLTRLLPTVAVAPSREWQRD